MGVELTANEIRSLLALEPNATCGFVRLTFVSKDAIAAGGLPAPFADGRPLGSALYFMVTPEAPVRLHRIRNDQLYHYYLGNPLEVFLLHADGTSERVVVGPDLRAGQRVQLLIPGNTFHTARLIGARRWFLGASTRADAGGPPYRTIERGLLGWAEPSLTHGGRTMGEYSEAFVAFDVAKAKHAVAIAEGGRGGEIRFLGEIENTTARIERIIKKLSGRYGRLHVCFEAGPTGYGLYRQIQELGHDCMVVAPALIPRRPGERVKTNRRDAVTLARLHRAGELTRVWVPDAVHEAIRDLVRAREAAADDLRRKRQQLLSFLLRHGRIYTAGRDHWTQAHRRWLARQSFEHAAQQIVFQEGVDAIEDAARRLHRLEEQLAGIVPSWSMAPVVEAYQAMRGASFLVAVTFAAEIGDVRRFDTPRQLMAFLGLVPGERSTGETVRRTSLTLAGNRRARRVLVEAAWTYRFPARVSETLRARLEDLPKAVRDIAWKAQVRLCARYRRLSAAGKKLPVVVAAIAREMAAFLWAIGCKVAPS